MVVRFEAYFCCRSIFRISVSNLTEGIDIPLFFYIFRVGSGLGEELITHLVGSDRMCVCVCSRESTRSWSRLDLGCSATEKKGLLSNLTQVLNESRRTAGSMKCRPPSGLWYSLHKEYYINNAACTEHSLTTWFYTLSHYSYQWRHRLMRRNSFRFASFWILLCIRM